VIGLTICELVVVIAVPATVMLSIGVVLGSRAAETHAIRHSDCATAHHMGDGFYYIVPESEYVKLIMLKYRTADAEPEASPS
jgi:archaellin